MIKPIQPHEISDKKISIIPDGVMEIWNNQIAANYSDGISIVLKSHIVDRVKAEFNKWDQNWLNIEDIYRNAGWIVKYDKPGWNENYPASFTFQKRTI